MKIVFLFLSSFSMSVFSVGSSAAYNANMTGVIKSFGIYADGDYIYVNLENQPSSHPECKPSWFVITAAVPAERRQMLFARLSMEFATKEKVNIGYDAQGECADGYIRLHRAG